MDSFSLLLKEVMQKPSLAGLQMICSQVEAWESYMPSKVKEKAQKALTCFRSNDSLVGEEDMLRLYRILAKYSRRLGAQKVFEVLESEGTFNSSLKFYLLWSECCAESNDFRRFTDVFNMARSRLTALSKDQLEAGFRDLVDQYFPTCDLFNDDEETKNIFANYRASDTGLKKSRRRSSLARLESIANKTIAPDQVVNTAFAPNTRAKLRFVLIDRPDDHYVAPSIEELRAAMLAEKQMTDDLYDEPMDITTTYSEAIITAQPNFQSSHTKEFSNPQVSKPPKILETVAECDSEISNDDKHRVANAADSLSCNLRSETSQKSIPEKMTFIPKQPAAPFISGSSFTEKAYNDMKAIFSVSVDINKGGLPGVTDETTRPVSPPVVESFEVFIDEHMTDGLEHKQSENATSQRPEILHGERIPLRTVPLHIAGGDSAKQKGSNLRMDIGKGFSKRIIEKAEKTIIIEDEETMAGAKFATLGIDKKPGRGIVTSTPAHEMLEPPTHQDFFAPLNNELEEQIRREKDEEALYAQSAFMRRRSSATLKCANVAKAVAAKITPTTTAEHSVESAMNNMKLGESKEIDMDMDELDHGDISRTGGIIPRQEVISTVNPWDEQLRKEVLRRSRKPCYQHDFDTPCPCISVGKSANLSGELYRIVSLIGQGGFAKVYKSINEEGKVLALKFESPSCAWEIYICAELRMRIDKEKRFTLASVMEITEAYVFTNASVLFNEYYPHGTLLDISNKMHDPSWHIILLIAIQIARILRDIHNAEIIHGDVKPDNFLIVTKLSDGHNDAKKIVQTPILKLIDWGRAIDMRAFSGQKFVVKGGTDKFDCPEMLTGRPWTYQTDYFGFVGTMHVVIFNKYAEVVDRDGVYRLESKMKRRLLIRPLLEKIFDDFLNIPDCDHLPSWERTVQAMEAMFLESFIASEWHQAVMRFNSCL